jgi:transcriptional regulator with XRE-family HTH domain
MADVYERGERLRKERIQLGRTLHQQVRLLGMHPEDLSHLEHSQGSVEELDRLVKIVRDKGPVLTITHRQRPNVSRNEMHCA